MNALLETSLANAAVATTLAVLAGIVSRFARRPALSHTLWVLVLLKLITPPIVPVNVNLPWPASASDQAAAARAQPAEAETLVVTLTELQGLLAQPDQPTVQTPEPRPALQPGAAAWTARALRWATSLEWPRVVLSIWLAGSLVWFARAGLRLRAFQRVLAHAKPAPEHLQERSDELAERLGLARRPQVWVVPIAVSPLLWALGGPARLILPATLLARLKPDECDALLMHELAHLKRHDHWVRWIEFGALGLYWWLPITWWARREIENAEEQCCDAWVVSSLPGAALTYARTLLTTVDFLSETRPAFPPAASGAGHVNTLRRRVTMILREPLYHRLSWPARFGSIALGLFVLPLAPQRAGAQSRDAAPGAEPADQKVVAVVAVDARDDDGDDDDDDSPGRDRNLEARMRRLEQRLDRLADAIKSNRAGSADRRPEAEERQRQRAEALEQAAKRRAEAAERRAQALKKAGEERERARVEARVRMRDLDNDLRDVKDPEEVARLKREIDEMVKKTVDPERMEKFGKDVEVIVNKMVDPKKMEQMGKDIEATIKKNLDSQKMEQLGKDIEIIVKKNVDPEKMEQLGKEIEKMVKQNIDPERLERLGKEIELRTRKIESVQEKLEKAKEKAKEKTKDDGAGDNAKVETKRERRVIVGRRAGEAERDRDRGRAESRAENDLDRRMREIEAKLDRLARELESRDAQPRKH